MQVLDRTQENRVLTTICMSGSCELTKDPIRFDGGVNLYGYSFNDPINFVDINGELPSLPQGVVNAVTGFGDGVYSAITLGFGDLQSIRDAAGIDGGVDPCSSAYGGGNIAGNIVGGIALGGSLASKFFGRGGWLNSNRYLRIGWEKHAGRNYFRMSGQLVKTKNGHVNIFPGRRY